ncbi:MAG: TolC family protein [Bacteroidales bacterium]|nr:TolC family protein [Bacteroidales bacterium]
MRCFRSLRAYSISPKRVLAVPQYQLNDRTAFTARPEMQMLSLRAAAGRGLPDARRRKYFPKVRAFGSAGYGRPGMNMLSEDFSTFWIAGAGLSWELWNWNKSGDEQQELSLRQRILEKEKAHIAKNFSAQIIRKRSEIENLRQQMEEDRQVLQLYGGIVASYASKSQQTEPSLLPNS